jgi:hypothetical protein
VDSSSLRLRLTAEALGTFLFFFLELLWYRPLTAIWRTWATLLVITSRRPGWESIPRGAAFREEPEAELAPAPLPR